MQEIGISDAVAHPLARYRNHLEFNGYHIEEGEDIIVCRHPRKPNLTLRQIPSRGVLISTYYSFDATIKRVQLLEYVNDLSAQFLFMKAYVDQENDLVMETFLEGDYDRTNFSILLDNVEYDMANFGKNELTQMYLK